MLVAVWGDKYRTGEGTVDEQHQELFRMVNELHDGIVGGKGKELMAPILDQLATYTVKHFSAEEALMKRTNYPASVEHIAKHMDLTKQVVDLIEKYKAGKLVLSITLSRFLANWLNHHILKDDMAFINHVKASTAR